MISTSAPGKVVLSGEYAVLDGAPAVAMAVSCRAAVSIEETTTASYEVTAPGYSSTVGRFSVADGLPDWQEGASEFALVDAAWRSLQPHCEKSLRITLDTSRFRAASTGQKFGVGSSAALTVALVAALCRYAPLASDIWAAAAEAHRALQGGAGSGVDVACAASGGVIEFRMSGPVATPLEWPGGLYYALLFSGVGADTADRIHRLGEAEARASRAKLVDASGEVAGAWRVGNVTSLLEKYHEYCSVLRRFSVDHDLGIFDAGHDAVARAAADRGLVYKPCGAGGGDTGIVLGADEGAVEAFAAEAATLGFSRLDIGLDPVGITTG